MAGWDDMMFGNLPPRKRQQPQIDWDAPPVGPADPRASMPQRIASAATDEGANALNWLRDKFNVVGDVAQGNASLRSESERAAAASSPPPAPAPSEPPASQTDPH